MSIFAQRALTAVVQSNCFELNGQLAVSKMPVEKHLGQYLRSVGWKSGEAKQCIDSLFAQVGTCGKHGRSDVKFECLASRINFIEPIDPIQDWFLISTNHQRFLLGLVGLASAAQATVRLL